MTVYQQLLPEWVKQEAILLAWPDHQTDWRPWLNEVQNVYCDIIKNLMRSDVGVILLIRQSEVETCKKKLPANAKVLLVTADYNDTWIRDYGFLTTSRQGVMIPLDFTFNGWGKKFNANKDNRINQNVLASLCQQNIESVNLILEGGAIEIDQDGTLLSTQLCLLNSKRNGDLTIAEYKAQFSNQLGSKRNVVFEHGHLEGDDTDGHIDTLVRFTPNQALVVQSAFNRPDDSHYASLVALVEECHQAFPQYKVFELPLPFIKNAEGDRLPASYANFLISNEQILCPVYQQPEDKLALDIMQQAYPQYKIVPINCLPLIQQFGSLHCISMQIPVGTLKSNLVTQLAKGVSQYAGE
ncbi:agmatine deiminase family protein [Paraglaciecola aquimarina]|uniref:Agmatine deiminase family protein n=1 Tax=Paraglaciecola algarum TaxID=3050085 RepID=A0ABS9D895_9ALTE|nr:agmatine deiminase family protein [Paraglaciecola sp. G1-23]MCF2949015.1 agmatine deiminase family protein [Paraglaciecola sp. G1-23]